MNPTRKAPPATAEDVRSRLEKLPGVEALDLTAFPDSISVRVASAGVPDLVGQAIHSLVATDSQVAPEVRVELTTAGEAQATARARFESLQVSHPAHGLIAAQVELDWRGQRFTGESEGEYNPAGELRVCGSAALRAVERIAGPDLRFTLVGVKELHVFDHDLVVVLIHAAKLADPRLIGTAIITEGRRRAAAIAALNATNRVLGRFA